jgi:hypothetical protein
MNVLVRGAAALPGRLLDTLPGRMWAPGNLWVPTWGNQVIGDWHCCVGQGRNGRSVRTIERNGRVVLHGLRPFDFAAHHESYDRLDGATEGTD